MLRSVLVPLDGSNFGEHALPLAVSIARRAEASLQLIQVHMPFSCLYADTMGPGTYEVESHVMAQERAYLDEVAQRLTACASIPITTVLLEGPLVAELLQSHATIAGVDLIVMATHGRGPLSRLWLGSVADEMVRRATTPVLLVRPHERAVDLTAEPPLRHILVPLDGSTQSEHVLEPARALGGVTQADFSLLRVCGPSIDAVTPSAALREAFASGVEQLQAEAQAYLDRVASDLKERGIRVRTHVVYGQRPANAILDTAHNLVAHLIALETAGRRGLPRLLLGSVADKVIRGASTPVLVHRSEES